MTPTSRRSFLLAPFALAAAGAAPAFAADDNSNEPMRIIVGYAPGGAADNLARIYAQQLQQDGLGNVIVENRPGASARLALDYVKRAKPDGKTIFIGPSPLFTIFPLTYRKLGYDADKDLAPVAVLTDVPTAISAGVHQPYKNLKEYMAWAKANPARANIGLATLGSAGHLGAVALSKAAHITITPVAYRGASPMLVDVVAGTVSMGWDAVASQVQLYRGGKIQFLAVGGTRRVKVLPEVPTAHEQGFPEFDYATSWYGAFVPAGTPPDVQHRLEQAFIAASHNADSAAKLEALGLEVVARPGTEARERMLRERAAWAPVVKASGYVAED
jgi:tripartite-type tricarboxylate transporter receptor subunit TctC